MICFFETEGVGCWQDVAGDLGVAGGPGGLSARPARGGGFFFFIFKKIKILKIYDGFEKFQNNTLSPPAWTTGGLSPPDWATVGLGIRLVRLNRFG